MTDEDLSPASRHALALVRLQSYEPTPELLTIMAQLDAGEITTEEALAAVDNMFA